ncbi:MAG: hypothetical protein ACFFCD_11870 [Promethearchaeota archaeon]
MKLPRKAFEYIDSSLLMQSPTKIRLEFILSFLAVCLGITGFIFWNSPGWIYYADVVYLQLVLSVFLIVVSLNVIWIVLAFERYFTKTTRITKYNIEFIASFATLPFVGFVVYVLLDFINNFRPIATELHLITALCITFVMTLTSLWCAFSLERRQTIKRRESGEEEEVWVEEWVESDDEEDEEYVDEDEEYVDEDFEVIDYSKS